MRVTGEIEAKAILKGEFRKYINRRDELMESRRKFFAKQHRKLSLKTVKKVYQDELAMYGDFKVFDIELDNCSMKKHWKSEILTVEPVLHEVKDSDDLTRLVLMYFDSKKFLNGQYENAIRKFNSNFYISKHFIERVMLRLNLRTVGDTALALYSIIEMLIVQNTPMTKFEDENYFVFRDYTFSLHKIPKSQGVCFKTVLLNSEFSADQKRKYKEAVDMLNSSDPEKLDAVMVGKNGNVKLCIPEFSGASLAFALTEKTLWMKDALYDWGMRGNEFNYIA
ncbi:hypothetical protein OFO16_04465 [Vibrio natriegens]|uniref:hypothetical protein n=1 Tax=Vibrio natriegens TaxID=691 RepID=UPI0021E8260D|nr:hypothetical protein [Vibrio natriegens]UYI47937.1 hypothetical protein OFO16_04465 [Vibrio natriegens]